MLCLITPHHVSDLERWFAEELEESGVQKYMSNEVSVLGGVLQFASLVARNLRQNHPVIVVGDPSPLWLPTTCPLFGPKCHGSRFARSMPCAMKDGDRARLKVGA